MREPMGHEEHLRQEEVDAIALEGGRALPARSSAHAAECERCRGEVRELGRLHSALLTLGALQPPAGLADKVMLRVTLPVPWSKRVAATLREHRIATAAAFAGLMGAVGLGLATNARYPELTPVTVAAFLLERTAAVAWSAVMYVGQLVYRTGLLAAAQSAAEQVTLATAFFAVATVTLVGLGALRIMLSLMDATTGTSPVTRR